MQQRHIWTIGHSTHSWENFIAMLNSFEIGLLVDIRNFPGSRKYPQFGQDAMMKNLPEAGISYVHLKALGGRRKPRPDSPHTAWRNEAFRGYADQMETPEFLRAATELEHLANENRTAYMCSEAVWWRCHRALLSDWLKNRGWKVTHIMGAGKAEEHPYTSPARIIDGKLHYGK